MTNYYESIHSKSGDKSWNQRNYKAAMVHYQRHMNALDKELNKNPRLDNELVFIDAYAFNLMNFMHAYARSVNQFLETCDRIDMVNLLIQSKKFEPVLKKIPDYLSTFSDYYSAVKGKPGSKLKVKVVANTFDSVSNILEIYSDLHGSLNDVPSRQQLFVLQTAATAMQMANLLLEKFNASKLTIDKHLSSLMYLELLYRKTLDKRFLDKMDDILRTPGLFRLDMEPESELELICYALLVDTKLYRASRQDLVSRGEYLIQHHSLGSQSILDFEQIKKKFEKELYRDLPPLGSISIPSAVSDDTLFHDMDHVGGSPWHTTAFADSSIPIQHSPVFEDEQPVASTRTSVFSFFKSPVSVCTTGLQDDIQDEPVFSGTSTRPK